MIQINPKFAVNDEAIKGEKWLPVIGFENYYEVSNLGRVRSKRRVSVNHLTGRVHIVGQILKQQIYKHGYPGVSLSTPDRGERKRAYTHQLVAAAFIGNPNNYHDINHKDENKANNTVSNLEYCDRKHNVNWGTQPERKKETMYDNTIKRFSDVIQYDMQMKEVARYSNAGVASRVTGFGQGSICRCCRGERNSAFGYIWRYASQNFKTRKILCYDLDGKLLQVFNSMKEAAESVGKTIKNIPNIISCCKGNTNTAYGYKWKYAYAKQSE